MVGRWNKANFVAAMDRQVGVVRGVLGDLGDVPIVPMIVFVEARWPFWCYLGLYIDVKEVLVRSPRQMAKLVSRPGPLDPEAIDRTARTISVKLKPA
jgi:hypothetical protein